MTTKTLQVKLTLTPELEKKWNELTAIYPVMSKSEIIKLAINNLEFESSEEKFSNNILKRAFEEQNDIPKINMKGKHIKLNPDFEATKM